MENSNVMIDEHGRLIYSCMLPRPLFNELITGPITGLIEFEEEPEFCNDRNIYFWRND